MGMSAGSSGGGPRRGRRRHAAMSEINMTPMVDVMLVLLIIFMVAAPMLTAGVPVDLPESNAKALASREEPLTISVSKSGDVFLQETRVDLATLPERLKAIGGERKETPIFIRGDRGIAYGQMMEIMGLVNAAGFRKVSLVTQAK